MAIRAVVDTGRGRCVRDCGMLALHGVLWLWLLVIILIIWLPASEFGGLDLTSTVVQGGSFAAGAVLLALAERSRPRVRRWHEWRAAAAARLAPSGGAEYAVRKPSGSGGRR